MKLTYSRNLHYQKNYKSLSSQSILTNDISNYNSFNSSSKYSNIYLSSDIINTNKIYKTPRKKYYNISSKERKPLENFLLTSIPSFKLNNKRNSKSFLKLEKEKGYKKYNNYHVHILNVMFTKKKSNKFNFKRKIDIKKYNIGIPKGYDLSFDTNNSFNDNKKKEKRFYVARIGKKINENIKEKIEKSIKKKIRKNLEINLNKRNSIYNKRDSLIKRFSMSNKVPFKFRKITSANVLNKIEKNNKYDIEKILMKNILTMKENEKKKKEKEIKKRLEMSKKVEEELIKEYYPINNIMMKDYNKNKNIIVKHNNTIFKEDVFISDLNNFSEEFHLKNKIENVKKERKVNIYIPKLHLSEIININALNDNVN